MLLEEEFLQKFLKSMKYLNKLIELLLDPYALGEFIWRRAFSRIVTNDELYIRVRFLLCTHQKLPLCKPQTFNEKLQWLKLYNHNSDYSQMVDKYSVKEYVKNKIGEKYIIPTIGVWDKFEDINFDYLPKRFVLKCTHDSGGIVICKDKRNMDIRKIRDILNKSLNRNYYQWTREWPYKNVKPRIIAETYMENQEGANELSDYKFYCFNGVPKLVMVALGRPVDTRFAYFDMDWNEQSIEWGYPRPDRKVLKPKNFEEMKALSSKLSQGIPHVRVDLYDINGAVFFGEFTFFDGGGHTPIRPIEWDFRLGSWISLPPKEF